MDLIDRQQAIEAMTQWDWQDLYLPIHFKQLLEELPTIEPRKGRWIDQIWAEEEATGLIVPLYMCDQCHTLNRERGNFCSNCGAMMEEGKTDV